MILNVIVAVLGVTTLFVAASGKGQVDKVALENATSTTDQAGFSSASVVPLTSQPPARLFVDSPLPDQLALGRVVIRYRTENLRIVQVFGSAALSVSPRIGHLHLTVDDAPWHWLDASSEPIVMNGFTAGPHKLLIELVDANHKVIESKTVSFEIPAKLAPH